MTTSANGRLRPTELIEAQKGVFLVASSARAFRRAAGAVYDNGGTLSLAGPGAGYRSYAVQEEFYKAGNGDKALAAKWHLNPSSSVRIAAPGSSSHGWGDRADLLWNGSGVIPDRIITLLGVFGWVREFGGRDPNHFQHKGSIAVAPVGRQWCIDHKLYVTPLKK